MQALVYDVHGNLPALDAVIADAGDVRLYILGGDYALFGGWPKETIERLQALPDALWIRGNGERWTANPDDAPDNPVVPGAIEAARAALGPQLVHELGALPTAATRNDTLICHGSPQSDVRSFLPEPADDEAELLTGVTTSRLIFGLPAVMHLAGPVMWWMPAWLDKRLPHFHIERPDADDEVSAPSEPEREVVYQSSRN